MRRLSLALLVWTAVFLVAPAFAVEPDEILDDPKLEQRARDISAGLRCLVCQNQSIDDSNAPLAKDLRVLVRERLKAGDTNEQVVDYVVARYGEFALLKPRFALHTLILWLAPLVLLLIALFVVYRAYANRKRESEEVKPQKLSTAEKRELKKLLDDA
jgi:cytochrome c-type biogenesis protein CcmH